jgi:hypothetical protein
VPNFSFHNSFSFQENGRAREKSGYSYTILCCNSRVKGKIIKYLQQTVKPNSYAMHKGNSGKSAHLIYILKFLGNGAEEEVGLTNV